MAPSSRTSSSSRTIKSCLAERYTSDIKACPCLAAYAYNDGNFVLVSCRLAAPNLKIVLELVLVDCREIWPLNKRYKFGFR
jgi:hypothetical protein